MLSNKDRALFHKWADALEEFKREDKSAAAKELRKERLAIEITWGGAEKLKQADKILKGAEKKASDAVAAGRAEVDSTITNAAASIKTAWAQIDAEKQRFVTDQVGLAKALEALAVQSQELEESNKIYVKHKSFSDQRDGELMRATADVKRREEEVAIREAEMKRKDDYYAGAPA